MKKEKNKIFVICITLIIFIGVLIISKTPDNKEIKLDDVKLKYDESNNSGIAIMIEQENADGTTSYVESTSNTWPTDMFFNEELSGCIDTNGYSIEDSLSYNSSTNSVSIKTKKKANCYLYFEMKVNNPVVINVSSNGGYKANLRCSDATGTFSNKYQRIEISNVGKKPICNLNYVTDEDEEDDEDDEEDEEDEEDDDEDEDE